MGKLFIRSKLFTRNSSNKIKGMVLTDLIIAILVSFLVLGMVLQLAIYTRTLYLQDQTRAHVNQNIRAGIDIVGTDIKAAGEKIQNPLFPVITLQQVQVNNTSPAVYASDLITRKDALGTQLTVCQNIVAGQSISNILVDDINGNVLGCTLPVDANGWPSNLDQWRNYRLNTFGGQVIAYIYDGNGKGEYFTYQNEQNPSGKFIIQIASKQFINNYNATSSNIYILDERRYRLCSQAQFQSSQNNCMTTTQTVPDNEINILQQIQNGTSYQNLIGEVANFQVQIFKKDGTTTSTFNATGIGDDWSTIQSIRVTLTGSNPAPSNVIMTKSNIVNRQISEVFFPRNVLSQ